jgi:hypothetical protein
VFEVTNNIYVQRNVVLGIGGTIWIDQKFDFAPYSHLKTEVSSILKK